MTKFDELGLHPKLLESLKSMGYNEPTPIQEQAIPYALEGRDIMGSAQTGTGKTAAFAIPIVQKLLSNPRGSALVLTPTRELGKQIMGIMQELIGKGSGIKTAFIIGGEPMGKQFAQLRARPRLIVGTPGRIFDHLDSGNMMLHDTKTLVLDETDRMLDMGFSIQLEKILKYLPAQRQTLMFSATLPQNIMKLSKKYLDNPERVSIGSTESVAQNLEQETMKVTAKEKYKRLLEQLKSREGTIVIFVKMKIGTERLAEKLRKDDFSVKPIHGDMRQHQRERVIKQFRAEKFRILVATDVVARGLDIPHIEHVINYDLPQVPEDYIHRIGRTARAGASGSSLCLITPEDEEKWHAIQRLIDPENAPKETFKKPRRRRPGGGGGGRPFKKRSFDKSRKPKDGKRDGEGKSSGNRKNRDNKKPDRKTDQKNNDQKGSKNPSKKKQFDKKGASGKGPSSGKPSRGKKPFGKNKDSFKSSKPKRRSNNSAKKS